MYNDVFSNTYDDMGIIHLIFFFVISFKIIHLKVRSKDEQNPWTQGYIVYKLSLKKDKSEGK